MKDRPRKPRRPGRGTQLGVESLESRRLLAAGGRGIPYLETFDQLSDLNTIGWSVSDRDEAYISADHDPNGTKQLVLDAAENSDASATLMVELPRLRAGRPLELEFFAKPIGEANDNILVIEISADSADWIEIKRINVERNGFRVYDSNLKNDMRAANIDGDEIYLRFRQINNGPSNNKYGIDDLVLTDRTVRLDAVFEATELSEGESTVVELTRSEGTERLDLALTTRGNRELIVPSTIRFDENEKTIQFEVTATNDGEIDGVTDGLFYVSGDNINTVGFCLTVLDDDSVDRRTIGGVLGGTLPPGVFDVVSSLEVPTHDALTLGAGTTLRFNADTELHVRGTLDAQGLDKDIVFTSSRQQAEAGNWRGVRITSNDKQRTILENVIVEFAQTGVSISATGRNAAATVSNSILRKNQNSGLSVTTGSDDAISLGDVVLFNNDIHDNQTGVSLVSNVGHCDSSRNSTAVTENNIHNNSQDGIRLRASGLSSGRCVPFAAGPGILRPRITGNHVTENLGRGIGGLATDDRGSNGILEPTIVGNFITRNGAAGLDLAVEEDATANAIIESNTFGGNDGAGISYDGVARIVNNLVTENQNGIESRQDNVVDASNNLVIGNSESNWIGFPRTYGIPAGDPAAGITTDRHGNVLDSPSVIGDGDFHLKYDSPAIGRAIGSANSIPNDIDGQDRDDHPDLGADEFFDRRPEGWANTGHFASRRDDAIVSTTPGPNGTVFVAGTRNAIGDNPGTAATILQQIREDGTQSWSHVIEGAGDARAKFTGADRFGNVYLVGEFKGEIDLDPDRSHPRQIDVLDAGDRTSVFVAQYRADGDFTWSAELGSDASQPTRVNSFAVHPSGDVVLGGSFAGTADFDPHPRFEEPFASNGGRDAYVWALADDGSYNWAWTAGGTNDDLATATTVDAAGSYRFAMSYQGTVTVEGQRIVGQGGSDVLFGRISANGRNFNDIGFATGTGDQSVTVMKTGTDGAVYYGGTTTSAMTVSTATDTQNLTADEGSTQGFVTSLSANNDIEWITNFTGATEFSLHDMTLRTGGEIVTVGSFAGSTRYQQITKDGQVLTTKTAVGLDGFSVGLSKQGAVQHLHVYGGDGDDSLNSVSIHDDGRAILGGYFEGQVELNGDARPSQLTSRGRKDPILMQPQSEHDIVPGDIDGDRVATAADIDLLFASARSGDLVEQFDFNKDSKIDRFDTNQYIVNVLKIPFGDSNLDGAFNPQDFVTVFRFAEYDDGVDGNSGWAEGDWNGDGDFDSSDFVFVFRWGTYSAAAKPLPSAFANQKGRQFAASRDLGERHGSDKFSLPSERHQSHVWIV